MAAVAQGLQKNRLQGKVPNGPGSNVLLVDNNKSNTLYLPYVIKAFRVNGAGAVKFTIIDEDGEEADITRAFAAGEIWDMCPVYRVFETGTVATGIDGIF